ncbi:MAG: cation:proton antiporter [Deltaproteobacteria bacterium]|nr:cation:proton antiporter [Deltaproteobacteria bacterium]
MITHPLLAVGLLLILGYLGGRAANALKLPRVSGYLVAGMLFSPSFFNILSSRLVGRDLYVITEMALSIIAYSIGGSLVLDRLKRVGRSVLWITLSQGGSVFLLTVAFLLPAMPFLTGFQGSEYSLLETYLPMALIIGALSIATAASPLLAIISELRASGPFTTTLLGVIAISYGLSIIFFALANTIANILIHPGAVFGIGMLAGAMGKIILSLLLGIPAAMFLRTIALLVRRREALLMVILGILFGTSGVASSLKLSPLLANMVVGFVIVNLERRHHDFFLVVEQIQEPLFGLFFGLAGAHIDLRILMAAGLLTVAILVIRMGGKQLGAWIGTKVSRAPEDVKKYMGLALFPKANLAVGLVLVGKEVFPLPIVSNYLVNVVVGTVIISQLIGLPLVKYALGKVGETITAEEGL